MKKNPLSILFLILPICALADWVEVGVSTDPEFKIYVEESDIKTTSIGTVTIWTLADYVKKQPLSGTSDLFKSRLSYWEIDCKRSLGKRLVINSFTGPMGTGIMLKSEEIAGPWLYISPRDVEKKSFEIACKKPL